MKILSNDDLIAAIKRAILLASELGFLMEDISSCEIMAEDLTEETQEAFDKLDDILEELSDAELMPL